MSANRGTVSGTDEMLAGMVDSGTEVGTDKTLTETSNAVTGETLTQTGHHRK